MSPYCIIIRTMIEDIKDCLETREVVSIYSEGVR